MKPALARTIEAGAALLLSLPLGAVLALLLLPLWSWIEAATGVGSIGHSGPATWCYAATSGLLFAAWAVERARRWRGERR